MWLISEALMQDYANSLCSPGQEEGFSRVTSLVGVPFAPSNGNHIQRAFLSPDRMTEFSDLSRYGLTFARFEQQNGEDLLTWFREASHVKTSAAPVAERVSPVRARDFGRGWQRLSVTWNRDACSWKTRPSFLSEGLTLYLETLPRWGSMLDGELWQRRTLGRITSETASGSLPTPVKYDSHGTWESNNYHGLGWKAKHDPDFSKHPARVARQWPTPVKNEDRAAAYTIETSFRHFSEGSHQVHLSQAVRDARLHPVIKKRERVPTPIRNDSKSGSDAAGREGGMSLKQRVRIATPSSQNGLRGGSNSEHRPMMWGSPGDPEYGELNPVWVEWLMDWPIGWTSLQPMDPAEFDRWRDWTLKATRTNPDNGLMQLDSFWWAVDPSHDGSIPRTTGKDLPARVERIAALGNGQVSAAAAAAFVHLFNLPFPGDQS